MFLAASKGDPLQGLAVIAVGALIIAAFLHWRRVKRRAIFTACAKGLGVELIQADADSFTAIARDLHLRFELSPGGKNSPNRTHATVKVPAPLGLVLYLRPQTASEERAVARGDALDISLGVPELDDAWIIEGAPQERVVRMLEDPALRAKVRDLASVSGASVVIEDNHVVVNRDGFDLEGGIVSTERIELALALARAAIAESARPLAPTESSGYRESPRPDGRGELAQMEALKVLQARRAIVPARIILLVSQLGVSGSVLFLSLRTQIPTPPLEPAVCLGVNLLIARKVLGDYLALRKRVPRGAADTLTLAAVGLANAFLVFNVVRPFLP